MAFLNLAGEDLEIAEAVLREAARLRQDEQTALAKAIRG